MTFFITITTVINISWIRVKASNFNSNISTVKSMIEKILEKTDFFYCRVFPNFSWKSFFSSSLKDHIFLQKFFLFSLNSGRPFNQFWRSLSFTTRSRFLAKRILFQNLEVYLHYLLYHHLSNLWKLFWTFQTIFKLFFFCFSWNYRVFCRSVFKFVSPIKLSSVSVEQDVPSNFPLVSLTVFVTGFKVSLYT